MKIFLAIICAAIVAGVFTAATRHRAATSFDERWPTVKSRWDNVPMSGNIEDRRD